MEWWQWVLVFVAGAGSGALAKSYPAIIALLRGRAQSARADDATVIANYQRLVDTMQTRLDDYRRRLDQSEVDLRELERRAAACDEKAEYQAKEIADLRARLDKQ